MMSDVVTFSLATGSDGATNGYVTSCGNSADLMVEHTLSVEVRYAYEVVSASTIATGIGSCYVSLAAAMAECRLPLRNGSVNMVGVTESVMRKDSGHHGAQGVRRDPLSPRFCSVLVMGCNLKGVVECDRAAGSWRGGVAVDLGSETACADGCEILFEADFSSDGPTDFLTGTALDFYHDCHIDYKT